MKRADLVSNIGTTFINTMLVVVFITSLIVIRRYLKKQMMETGQDIEGAFARQYKLNTTAVVMLVVCLLITLLNQASEYMYAVAEVYYCVDDVQTAFLYTLLTFYFISMVKQPRGTNTNIILDPHGHIIMVSRDIEDDIMLTGDDDDDKTNYKSVHLGSKELNQHLNVNPSMRNSEDSDSPFRSINAYHCSDPLKMNHHLSTQSAGQVGTQSF